MASSSTDNLKTTTTIPTSEDFADMTYYKEVLIFSILPLTFLLAASRGARAWAKWEILISIAVSLVHILNPELVSSIIMNSPLKPFHYFLFALAGSSLASSIGHSILLLYSNDVSAFYGHYFGKLIASTLITIESFIVYREGIHFNYKFLCLVTSVHITNMVINAYFLSRTPKPSGQNPFLDIANSVGKIDFYILCICGTFVYAFPDLVNGALAKNVSENIENESYRSLIRATGAVLIGMSIESFCLSEFKFIRDKKKLLFARILRGLAECAVFYAGHHCYKVYSHEIMKTLLLLNGVYDLIVLFGFIMTPSEHKIKAKNN